MASYTLDLHKKYDLKLIDHVAVGLTVPQLPPVNLMLTVAIDVIAISFVSYSISISMAMLIAKRQNYGVLPQKELMALVK